MGVTLALELKRRYPDCSITLLEKEEAFGLHASGRNSGVLHAGFYYTANSLKARFTREGNRQLTEYCKERRLALNQCGKIVVAKNEEERHGIRTLLHRGQVNKVEVQHVTEAEAQELEPHARTVGEALYSPTTSTIDPTEVMRELVLDAQHAGVRLVTQTAYQGRTKDGIRTSSGIIQAGYVVNAAGLYADRIARNYGYAYDVRILPFKGLYLYENGESCSLRRHIYPVPDLRNPFLGVHFTITAKGKAKIGPTAIPALWRENYSGLKNPRWGELAEVARLGCGLFLNNRFGFRTLALQELPKYTRRHLASLAGKLVEGVDMRKFKIWGKPGIRAQPVNLRTRKLEMDFLYQGDNHSFHLLNAVSPALTYSLPFSAYLVDRIDRYLHHGQSEKNR
ncbi:MAG: FAD-dependent oxidoreductase [Desulfobacteraceae bacterium]|nr:FAD-dependent oxidoreductase [Desulfobacteraceae bacterium]